MQMVFAVYFGSYRTIRESKPYPCLKASFVEEVEEEMEEEWLLYLSFISMRAEPLYLSYFVE